MFSLAMLRGMTYIQARDESILKITNQNNQKNTWNPCKYLLIQRVIKWDILKFVPECKDRVADHAKIQFFHITSSKIFQKVDFLNN